MSNNIYQALPIMAMMTEATKRFPNWNRVLTLANNCDVMQKGGQLLQNLATGEVIAQLPGQAPGVVPVVQPDGTTATVHTEQKVAATGDSIQGLKAEINKTQGRALSTVESGIRADMKAGFDEIKLLLTPHIPSPEE